MTDPAAPESHPLSSAQERLWFLHQLDPRNPVYNIFDGQRLRGPLDVVALEQALRAVVQRQQMLRATFEAGPRGPVQIVRELEPAFALVDLTAVAEGEREARAREHARQAIAAPFDLERGPVLRATLLRLAADEHWWLLASHHVSGEVLSFGVLNRELQEHYNARLEQRPARLPPLPVQFFALARRERERLAEGGLARELAHWKQALASLPAPLQLPADRRRPEVMRYRGAWLSRAVDPALPAALKALCARHGVTPFMALLAAFQVLLSRLSGQTDLVVGTGFELRPREAQHLVGFFMNTLALRGDLEDDPSFVALLQRTRERCLDAYAHAELPFERLVAELQPERTLRHTVLLQAFFTMLHAPATTLALRGVTAAPIGPDDVHNGGTKVDLHLLVEDRGDALRLGFEYSTDLLEERTVERWLRHLETLLHGIVEDPSRPVSRLPLLAAAERQAFLAAAARSARYPVEDCLHQRFAAQVARTPQALAVRGSGEAWTYAELEARGTKLARRLHELGVRRGAVVGICLARTPRLAEAILGIHKAGAAYVPLDPIYPDARLRLILDDAHCPVVVTEAALQSRVQGAGAAVLCLDDAAQALAAAPAPPIDQGLTPDDLAYVLYTSGSTGVPKGVQVTHRSALRLFAALQPALGLRAGDTFSLLHSYSFDLTVWELWGALLHGGCVVVVPPQLALSPPALAELLAHERVTVLTQTPSAFRLLVAHEEQTGQALGPALRLVLIAGEALEFALLRSWFDRHGDQRPLLVNAYGPTEAAVYTTFRVVRRADVEQCPGSMIGPPLADMQVYLLDARREPVPIGVPGELWIGGPGVARGYLGREALTKERFVPDPWSGVPGALLYRTGDLARWADGGRDLEYLGRLDQQVKIRGYRIELGELEVQLGRHPAVSEVVAVAHDFGGGDLRLVAYVVPRPGHAAPGTADARAFLRSALPEFMLPAAVTVLERMPVNRNGKVDRAALPRPHLERDASAPFQAPRTGVEETIAGIWRQVLGVERIGAGDSFFDLGGHSLLLVRAHALLTRAFPGKALTMLDLFRWPTLAALAQHLSQDGAGTAPLPVPAEPRVRASAEPSARAGAIAITGLACRVPGADSPDELWRNLCAGVESVSFFGEAELLAAGVDPALLARPDYVRAAGGLVRGVELFDAAFFGFSAREAELLDPQQRLFLEAAWHALEHAGRDAEQHPGRIGVFGGEGRPHYFLDVVLRRPDLVAAAGELQAALASDKDWLTTRVSHALDLQGPSVNVQTACSTALVAVHLACQSLRTGECDLALAGGVSVSAVRQRGYLWQEGGTYSQDGHCRAFDAAAKGMVGGDGVVVLVLERLEDALRERSTIWAVIQGSAVNNDGALRAGYTAPGLRGQAQVIAAALAASGVDPRTIGMVEAHGTGTALGDPIEVAALTQAWRAFSTDRGWCALGSVKTNLGHLSAAAGGAGLLKAALALHHGRIPPSLHFEQPNPAIDFAASPFFVNTELRPFPEPGPRRAAVSSFGMGGTNAHLVLEQAPLPLPLAPPARAAQLLVLSAKTQGALDSAAMLLAEHLEHGQDHDLADVAFTLQAGRRALPWRRAAVVADRAGAIAALRGQAPARNGRHEGGARGVAFLFPGQGAQRAGMAAGLYAAEPAFREALDRCAALLVPALGEDLLPLLLATGEQTAAADRRLQETALAQPALLAVSFALAELWRSFGVEPRALLGHSAGEYVAACVAGVLSLEETARLVAARGRSMQARPPGAMLAVPLPEADVVPLLGDGLELAAVNGPSLCVVSGPSAAVERFAAEHSSAAVPCRRLHVSHAFHSASMDPVRDEIVRLAAAAALRPARIPAVSTVTGGWIQPGDWAEPGYWGRNLRSPVRFAGAVQALLAREDLTLLEVGPGSTLTSLARQCPQAAGRTLVATMPAPEAGSAAGQASVLDAAGRLWLAGVRLRWQGLHGGPRRRVPLPGYPFERRRCWVEAAATGAPADAPRPASVAGWLWVPSWQRTPPPLPAAPAARAWIVLGEGERAERLAAALLGAGAAAVEVAPALAPALQALSVKGLTPERVVLLGKGGGTASAHPAAPYFAVASLLQALGERLPAQPVGLDLLVDELHDVLGGEARDPARATALGPCLVAPIEQPQLRCRVLDVAGGTAPERIALELLGAGSEPLVALRGAHRWVRTFTPLATAEPASPWRERGTYLITGGLGGLGASFAAHLARSARARLVLLTRTVLPPLAQRAAAADPRLRLRLDRLAALEAAGAEVLTIGADVADQAQVRAALAQARQRFGPLHGVIHAAGVGPGGMLARRARSASEAVLAPKVAGTLTLLDALRGERLDFFALCSSLAAVQGGAGAADYAAANAFLDALAQCREHADLRLCSIGFATWAEVGMAAETEVPAELRAARAAALAAGIRPHEGCLALERALGAGQRWLLVSPHDPRARAAAGPEPALGEAPAAARPVLPSSFAAPETAVQQAIAAIWSELLGVRPIGLDDSFFELGGHSLTGTRVAALVKERLQVDLGLERFFAAPTVRALAQHVEVARWVRAARPAVPSGAREDLRL